MEPLDPITRREFLRAASVTVVAAAVAPSALAFGETRSRVVMVRDEKALDSAGRPNAEVIQAMLDRGMCELQGTRRPADAWRQLFDPAVLVGIKTNRWESLPTPQEVETAIAKRLIEIGVPPNRLPVDDRGARQTLASCAALVNARPLRTHHWAGIGGCIKNPIVFAEEPSVYHPDMCADLATLWNLPILKGKIRLNVLVALTPQFYTRGPHHFDTRYVWPYKGILLSRDPVAVDTIGVRLLEARRRVYFGEDRPLTQLAHHVRFAGDRHGLGVADAARIDLVRVGWDRDILV